MTSEMGIIEEVFDRMDRWRHLPKYALERRSDIFFGIYMKTALEKKYGIRIKETIIPEFPIHKPSINDKAKTDQSVNVDYFALSEDNATAFLIELKTDMESRRQKQDEYLRDASKVGLEALLRGLIRILQATNKKRKYFHLFRMLEEIGMMEIPDEIHQKFSSKYLRGITAMIPKIRVTAPPTEVEVVYIQPRGKGENIISFKEFASLIDRLEDPVVTRFTESLIRWSEVKAGRTEI